MVEKRRLTLFLADEDYWFIKQAAMKSRLSMSDYVLGLVKGDMAAVKKNSENSTKKP